MSDLAVTLTLCGLALVDAAFASWRTATGRDGRLSTPRREWVSFGWGVAAWATCLGLITLACIPALRSVDTRSVELAHLIDGGRRMLGVYLPMAALVVFAVAVHLIGGTHDRRAAAMTIVLGPLTLLRPVVIAAGALVAAWPDPGRLWLPALVTVASVVAIGPVLGWIRFRHLHWRRRPVD